MKKDIFIKVSKLFKENGFNIYLVGGAVRDFLLGKANYDYDFVTDADVENVKKIFPNGNYQFEKYGVSQIVIDDELIDIVTLRIEEYDINKRKPSKIRFTKSLEEDSYRRDFTINALYQDINNKIYDFHFGLKDLDNRIIKVIGDINIRMNEDPLRILRCLRFKIQLDFSLDETLDRFIKDNLILLNEISPIIISKEIKKIKEISFEKFKDLVNEYKLDNYIYCDELEIRRYNVIDLHCDTITKCYQEKKLLIKNDLHIDINKLIKGQYLMQCFAIFLDSKLGNPYLNFLKYYDFYIQEIEKNKHYLFKVLNYQDLIKAKSLNKIGAFLSIEEGEVLENDLSRIYTLYEKGVRMMTLTWNYSNCIGHSHNIDKTKLLNKDKGLTEFGKQVIKVMNEIGMIIDVSHLSTQGFYDVIELSTSPIVLSHSNCRSICDVSRNVTDEMILLLHKNKGLMGINYFIDFVGKEGNYLENIINHIKHIKDLGCIDNICLGSDFDGIDTPPILSSAGKMNYLYDVLIENGFSKIEIEKIFFKNFIRVMKNVLK